jgi:hypothetical protein
MRRIIERVVTVVTTTTWKISWEADTPHSDSPADPASNDLPNPKFLSDVAHRVQSDPLVIETKEADLQEPKTETNPMGDEPPQDS